MLNRLKGFLYDCIGLLARSGARKQGPLRLLIVRVDEIGDYMLWRNFLQEIVTSDLSIGYEVHFCGNSSWKSLFETFDKHLVQDTYWIDKIRFKKDLRYRLGFLRRIYRQRFDIVINPTFSRDKRNDDAVVFAAAARKNIGMVANEENIRSYEKGYDRGLYSDLFAHPSSQVLFEFTRNRLFTEFIIDRQSGIQNTRVPETKLPAPELALPEKYFIVFPGSRSKTRIWPATYFAITATWFFEKFGWTAVICGSKDDIAYAEAFKNIYSHPVTDITGQTSLPGLMTVLKKAQCLLSVDTGSVHLAAATGCTVFAVYNGSQYGRFAPYPAAIAANFYPVYPDAVEKDLGNPSLMKRYEFVADIPYDTVAPEKMIRQIQKHYNL